MILKKEQISNAKIECYLNLNSKISKVVIANKTFEMDLSSIKEIEPSNEYDVIVNYLLRINKLLTNLKTQDENFINSDVTIFVDNEMLVKIIKPEGVIIKKPSKEFKKSIDNQRLKAMLGITLQELSNFKNIDLIFKKFLQKEESNMNNNDNNFNYSIEDDNFDLNMDISGLSDMINVSDIDSLNYDENDLFKEFDLNADNLFTEKSADDFDFKNEDISIPDYVIESNKDELDTNAKDDENFEFIYNSDDFTENKEIEDTIPDEIPAIEESSFNIDDEFIFIPNEDEKTKEKSFIFDSSEEDKSDEFVFTTDKPEEFIYTDEEEDKVYTPNQEEGLKLDFEESTETYTINEDVIYPIEETFIDDITPETIEVSITNNDEIHPVKEEDIENTTPEKTERNIISEVDNKEENIEIYEATEIKENTLMNENNVKNNIENNKTLDINDEFIQNELVELKNLLKSKANSYRNKFSEMNAQYEQKHLALKDLNLTDETQQFEIFKEFLTCKSTMVSLKALDDTCMKIISDIDNKIFNIKK